MADFQQNKDASRLRSALAAVMVGIILIAAGFYFVWQNWGYPSELSAAGTLTSSQRNPAGPHQRWASMTYAFAFTTSDGRRTEGSFRTSDDASLLRDGDTVTVLYRPDAPARARLAVNGGGAEYVPFGLGAIALLGGLRVVVLELLKRRRQRPAVRSPGVSGA